MAAATAATRKPDWRAMPAAPAVGTLSTGRVVVPMTTSVEVSGAGGGKVSRVVVSTGGRGVLEVGVSTGGGYTTAVVVVFTTGGMGAGEGMTGSGSGVGSSGFLLGQSGTSAPHWVTVIEVVEVEVRVVVDSSAAGGLAATRVAVARAKTVVKRILT